MTKFVLLFAVIMIAATVVNCHSKASHNHNPENIQRQREQAQMQQVLEEHSKIVGMGLTGRLASSHPGPAAAGKGSPSVHEHVSGHRRCRNGALC